MAVNKKKAIERAKELLGKTDASHGLLHAGRVVMYSLKIADNYLEADQEVIEIAGWWHDVGRIYSDKGHQLKSAEMAEAELPDFGYSKDFSREVYKAIVDHSSHAKELPKNIEGKLIKDADKLEFLTLERWRETIDAGLYHYIDMAIDDIPKIRNKLLFFPESKKEFDKLLTALKEFAKLEKEPSFDPYKMRIANLENLD